MIIEPLSRALSLVERALLPVVKRFPFLVNERRRSQNKETTDRPTDRPNFVFCVAQITKRKPATSRQTSKSTTTTPHTLRQQQQLSSVVVR